MQPGATPLFIGGMARSGTTLLSALLDGHPDVVVLPAELHFFRHVLPMLRTRPREGREFFLWLLSRPRWYLNLDEGVLRSVAVEVAARNPGSRDLLPAAAEAFARATGRAGARIWVDKTPQNEFHAGRIARWYPGARILHLVRDPRAVLASTRGFQKRAGRPLRSPFRLAVEWEASQRRAARNPARLPTFVLRYEDLVRDPEAAMREVASFLGLPWHECLLRPTLAGHPYGGYSAWSGHDTGFTGVDASSAEKWREGLPRRDARCLEAWLRPTMRRHGYACEAPLDPPGRLAVALGGALLASSEWLNERLRLLLGDGLPRREELVGRP